MNMRIGIKNAEVLLNFKKIKCINENDIIYPQKEIYEFCTFSRVCMQEVACPHRKRACPLLGREGDAYCRCRHDGRMGKGIGTHRAWGTARR